MTGKLVLFRSLNGWSFSGGGERKGKSGARERPPDALGRRVHGRGGIPISHFGGYWPCNHEKRMAGFLFFCPVIGCSFSFLGVFLLSVCLPCTHENFLRTKFFDSKDRLEMQSRATLFCGQKKADTSPPPRIPRRNPTARVFLVCWSGGPKEDEWSD